VILGSVEIFHFQAKIKVNKIKKYYHLLDIFDGFNLLMADLIGFLQSQK